MDGSPASGLDAQIASASRQELENALVLLRRLDEKRKTSKLEHYTPYDFQKRFHHACGYQQGDKLATQRALIAANQIGKCVTAKTLIDTPKGKVRADSIKRDDIIYAWNDGVVAARVGALVRKPSEACYRVWLDNGQWFECAARHRILTRNGYAFFESLMLSLPVLPASSEAVYPLESFADVQCYLRKFQGSQDDYRKNHYSGDAPLLMAANHVKTYNSIICYQPIGDQEIYDFWVPDCGNYIAAGVVHHNTRCGSMEIAMHLTGNYPKWWSGHRFARPIDCLVASNTNETTRDICQEALFGDPSDDEKMGTGAIPLRCIGERTSKPGVPNAFDTVLVKHTSGGWSKVQFKAYEQGFKKFMGKPRDLNWLDEEPPQEIWSQIVRGTFARKDALILVTLTPEEGMTEVVRQFLENLQPGQALIRATWDDAPHMTKEMRANKLASIPQHERAMRSTGTPMMGAGLVFPFDEKDICVDPIQIPRHWPQIIGIDFGWSHPFAACNLAYDRDSDCIYLTADYREAKVVPAIHAAAIRPWGPWKPVAWPHDGLNTEKGTGDELRKAYQEEGLQMLPWKATNPPQAGQKEGEGGNSVEASILEMFERLETGRLKVFKTCKFWLEEQRGYHRDKNAKLVKLYDDTISASRYGVMMIRHARIEVVKRRQQAMIAGASNW